MPNAISTPNLPAVVLSEHEKTQKALRKVFEIFEASQGVVRPHFILTGPSGSGKTWNIQALADEFELNFLEINAAQLTKEGTAGNSLSKALAPLTTMSGPVVCFVDEFDKLFISGNQNSDLAHEITHGVQNEFLKVLESTTTSVFGDFGKYTPTKIDNVLFVFAGAFNGEADIDLDKLREFGVKTEFLGRVGLIYNLPKVSLDVMMDILDNSKLLKVYLNLFPQIDKAAVVDPIKEIIKDTHDKNTLGVRMINTLIHQFFINGGPPTKKQSQQVSFQKTLTFGD